MCGDDCGKMERSESKILNPGVPAAARNGASSYPGSGAPLEARNGVVLLGPGAPSSNAVACPDPDALVPPLGSAAPPGPSDPERRVLHRLASDAARLPRGGPSAPERRAVPQRAHAAAQLRRHARGRHERRGVLPRLRRAPGDSERRVVRRLLARGASRCFRRGDRNSPERRGVRVPRGAHGALGSHHGLPTVGQNAAPFDPGMPVAHLSSCMSYSYPGSGAPSAAVNGVAYPGGLGAVTKNAACYAIDAYEGAIGFDFDHLNPTGIATAAAGQDEGSGYDDSSGLPLPSADKETYMHALFLVSVLFGNGAAIFS
ncbi:unnamed protein product [Urochloa humidicola]